jgi:GTPase SAR1 family protein
MSVGSPRIVVVGSCATGKSTLVAALRERGFDASANGQEHSEIPTLWNHTSPDLVVLLEADLETIRARRGPWWPESIYTAQQRRLANARLAADVVVDTARTSVADTVQIIADHIDANIETGTRRTIL